MDLPALERAASALENSLDFWEGWLAVSTLLVVVGLILEYWHEVRDLIKEPIRWESAQKILGAILVTVGVSGELVIQYKASTVETKVRSAAHNIEGLLNKQAEELRRGNLLLQAEVLKLRAAMADRDLSPDQQHKIHEACRKFSGKAVYIRSYPNDPEAASLIVEIKAAMEPFVHVEDRTGEMRPLQSLVLGIRVAPEEHERKFAEAIVRAFRLDGNLTVDEVSPVASGLPVNGDSGRRKSSEAEKSRTLKSPSV